MWRLLILWNLRVTLEQIHRPIYSPQKSSTLCSFCITQKTVERDENATKNMLSFEFPSSKTGANKRQNKTCYTKILTIWHSLQEPEFWRHQTVWGHLHSKALTRPKKMANNLSISGLMPLFTAEGANEMWDRTRSQREKRTAESFQELALRRVERLSAPGRNWRESSWKSTERWRMIS